MNLQKLRDTAVELVADGKGILAADESSPTIKKRFDGINVESTEESRRAYRDMLFTTAGIDDWISGVILFEETLFQKSADGTPFPELLASRGIIPGIKVDKGAKPLAGSDDEKVTEGLDGLRDRLAKYAAAGARFAKWRAVIEIGADKPSDYCLHTNAHALARYAALCQEAGIVPIVEPEVLMDGSHSINRCQEVTENALNRLYAELAIQNVDLAGTLLKPNMVISGNRCADQADVATVAKMTIDTLRKCVPDAVPGVVFLSGGQSDEIATAHLNAINSLGDQPWALSFSYGRALQAPALKAWGGTVDGVSAGQAAFQLRARNNCAAATGDYADSMEQRAA